MRKGKPFVQQFCKWDLLSRAKFTEHRQPLLCSWTTGIYFFPWYAFVSLMWQSNINAIILWWPVVRADGGSDIHSRVFRFNARSWDFVAMVWPDRDIGSAKFIRCGDWGGTILAGFFRCDDGGADAGIFWYGREGCLFCCNCCICHSRRKNAALRDIRAWSRTCSMWLASLYLCNIK